MSNITIKKEAWEFLLFSYFGSTDPKIEDCINRAYRDLCRTLSGIALEEIKLKDCQGERKDESRQIYEKNEKKILWKKTITSIIEEAIKKLSKETFDDWHKDTCDNIKKESVDRLKDIGVIFEYGHAQKWLNMTLKYQMMFDEKFNSQISAFIHVPVDSFIMEAASNIGIKIPCKKVCKEKYAKYSESKSEVWSKWDGKMYTDFQKELREHLRVKNTNPIDWEAKAWIEVANTRSTNERENSDKKFKKIKEDLSK